MTVFTRMRALNTILSRPLKVSGLKKKSVHFIFIICVVLRSDGRLLLQKGRVGTAIKET